MAVNISLEGTIHTPIAELSENLEAPATRSIRAIVTLTWPFSSATGSVAFLLAEPDFRLRRSKGQVRVQFSGSSARHIAKAGIASGDEVTICLDGVEWIHDEAELSTPGRGIEYELKFTERLLLKFRQEDSAEIKLIDIDHPTPEPEATVRIPSPDRAPSPSPTTTSIYSRPGAINGNEWSSPAFIKRARTSYGSLFDNDYDPFAEEDGSIRGKGRKRTRLSSTWRYESRSPTPEAEEEEEEEVVEEEQEPKSRHVSPEPAKAWAPMITKEDTTTVESALEDAAESLADLSRLGTNGHMRMNGITRSKNPNEKQPEAEQSNVTGNAMPPPIQTRMDFRVELSSPSQTSALPPAPDSPRLRPISSDTLPLVSPLVPPRFHLFSDSLNRHSQLLGRDDLKVHTTSESLDSGNIAMQNPEQSTLEAPVNEEPEDLYGVSPSHHRDEHQLEENIGFGDSTVAFTDFDNLNEEQFISENQYGHWQTVTAASSHQDKDIIEEHRTLFDMERDEDDNQEKDGLSTFQHDGFHPLISSEQQVHHYPEPDDELHVPRFGTGWVHDHGSNSVAYPDLPDSDSMHPAQSLSLDPRSKLMSRSQSTQSEVVDLTDSDEEQGDIVLEDQTDEECYKGSVNDLGDEERYDPESPAQSPHFEKSGEGMEVDDVSEGSQEEEETEEDRFENDEHFRRYPDGESDEHEEEESYDEEDVEEDQEPPIEKGAPVFIDLLSSDDEEDKEPAPNHSADSPGPGQRPDYSEDEESELEEEYDEDENVPFSKRSEFASSPLKEVLQGSTKQNNAGSSGSEEDHGSIESFEHDEGEDASDADSEIVAHHEETALDEHPREDLAIQSPGPFKHSHEQNDSVEVRDVSPTVNENNFRTFISEVNNNLGLDLSEQKDDSSGKISSFQAPFSLLNQISNLDGANDDSRIEIMYPTLATDETAITNFGFAQSSQSMTASGALLEHENNLQILTPDDAQVSRSREPKVPFPSTTEELEHVTQERSTQMPIDPTLTTDVVPVAEPDELDQSGQVLLVTNEIEIERVSEKSELDGKADHVSEKLAESTIEVDVDMSIAGNIIEAIEVGGTSIVDDGSVLQAVETSKPQVEAEVKYIKEEPPAMVEDKMPLGEIDLQVPSVDEHLDSLEMTVEVSPRRSRRIRKSSSSIADPTENVSPRTPTGNRRKADPPASQANPAPIAFDDRRSPMEHDASIEMALSALDSPAKQHDLRKQPIVDLRLKLIRALRTELSEYTSLKVLRYHINKKLDILAIATTTPEAPQRAKGGPRHYQITFNVTDPSIAPSAVTEIQILRPYKDALPTVHTGDGILLRNFQVISLKDKGFGLRSEQAEASSWAVFKDDEDNVEVRGPPVEYGDAEKNYFSSLKLWFKSLDSVATAKLSRANVNKGKSSA